MKSVSRESNIELLKVIAVFMIVLCHTAITMTSVGSGHSNAIWFYDINSLPNCLEKFILTFYNYCGFLGNDIFFVCSAWFMVDKKKNKTHKNYKVLKMETDVWIISAIFLTVFVICGVHMHKSTVIRALFPTVFNNNWFATSYMVFFILYPWLNRCIEKIPRVYQKYACLFLVALICILLPLFQAVSDFRFTFSYLMMWVVVYLCVSYLKSYHRDLLNNQRFAIVVLLIGITGLFSEVAATYYLGESIPIFHGDGMRWNKCYNLFEWLLAFGCFNLFRSFRFQNLFINRLSSLSLLIYLIHGNFLVRRYVRPLLYNVIYSVFHNQHVPLWLLLFSLVVFVISALFAYMYQNSIQKFAYHFSDKAGTAIVTYLSKYLPIRRRTYSHNSV